jgi:hypothetical protein
MKLKSVTALIGALIGIGGITGLYFGLGISWPAVAVVVGVAIASYIVAAVGAASRSSISAFGEFMRGWLVGLNVGLNGFLAFALMNLAGGLAAGIIVGLALGILNFLTVFEPISQSEVFQGFLGWLTWLMPMSWLVVGLGLVFYLICFLGHAFTAGKVPYLRVQALGADWKTGTFFVKGGLISNLNPIDTAFNMGNFSFVDYKSGAWHKDHEAGHTLNLAAFGSIFHLIGALDENVFRRGANAFSERLAESNSSGTSGSNIPMWA